MIKKEVCLFFFFFAACRQQVPERNQKKKKKMKWRAERSTASHRFHCAILWPSSSSPSSITRAHTHAHTPTNLWMSGNSPAVVKLREHKRDWGLVEEWLDGSRKDEIDLKCWTRPLTMPRTERYACPPHYMVLFKGFSSFFENLSPSVLVPEMHSYLIYELTMKRGTRQQTVRQRQGSESPWTWNLLSSWAREGKAAVFVVLTPSSLSPRTFNSGGKSSDVMPDEAGFGSLFSFCRADEAESGDNRCCAVLSIRGRWAQWV